MVRPTLARRLTATFAACVVVLLLVLGLAVDELVGRQLALQLDDRLAGQADALAADVDPADVDDPVRIADDLWGLTGPPRFDAQLLRSDGGVAVSTGSVPGGDGLLDDSAISAVLDGAVARGTVAAGDQVLRVHGRAVPGTSLVLVVASDLDPVVATRRALLQVLVPVGGVGVVALAGLGALAVRRGLGPLQAMAEPAGRINVGDLDVRLPVPRDAELARLARTLNGMLDRLQAAVERERTFVADASHELRTPLAILRAELELVAARVDVDAAGRVASAVEEVDRLARTVDDLLVLARADTDQPAQRVETDLHELARRVVERQARQAGDAGVELEVLGGPVLMAVDAGGIDRALRNLVENAVRHAPRGSVVELALDAEPAAARLVVRDRGPGVAEHLLGQLFDRFRRTDPSRGGGAAGLGLAIVASVAAQHGGRVGAANRPGGGLEVWLVVPRPPSH